MNIERIKYRNQCSNNGTSQCNRVTWININVFMLQEAFHMECVIQIRKTISIEIRYRPFWQLLYK
jgi:hypothetical protein